MREELVRSEDRVMPLGEQREVTKELRVERLARPIARWQWHTTATLFNLDHFQMSTAILYTLARIVLRYSLTRNWDESISLRCIPVRNRSSLPNGRSRNSLRRSATRHVRVMLGTRGVFFVFLYLFLPKNMTS